MESISSITIPVLTITIDDQNEEWFKKFLYYCKDGKKLAAFKELHSHKNWSLYECKVFINERLLTLSSYQEELPIVEEIKPKTNNHMLLPATQLSQEVREQLRVKFEQVSKRLDQIEIVAQSPFRTNGKFKFAYSDESQGLSNDQFIDLTKTTDLKILIRVLGFLVGKKNEYELGAKHLKITTFPVFSWQNYSFDDWFNDINIRISFLTSKNEKEKLEKIQTELSGYFSAEDRLKTLLDQI